MLYKLVTLLGLQLVVSVPQWPPECVCDAYYGGLTTEVDDGTWGCMKWHRNNPDAGKEFIKSGRFGRRLAAAEKKGNGLPPNPGVFDPANDIFDSYQIVCMPTDKNIKTGDVREYSEDWQGGCPADMDVCSMNMEGHTGDAEQRYHYDVNNPKKYNRCECDNYQGGARPIYSIPGSKVADTQQLCGIVRLPGEVASNPERADNYGRQLAGTNPPPLDDGIIECRPRSNGYDEKFGEGFQNYGCDHPMLPCVEEFLV